MNIGVNPEIQNLSKTEKNYWAINQYSKLVTPFQIRHLPVYQWYTYKHSFSRNLVHSILEKYEIEIGERVLDPFCGAGTTLLATKEMGVKAMGVDLMPLSILSTNVKLHKYSKVKVLELYKDLTLKTKSTSAPLFDSSYEMLYKYFPKGTLDWILSVKFHILDIEDKKYRDLFLLCLLSILEDASYTRKDGAFLRTVQKPRMQSVESLFEIKVKQIYNDLWFANSLPGTRSKAFQSDARKIGLERNSIASVITSPPYPNRHDYTRIYLLELMIGFIDNYDGVKDLRYNLLRSHVEARERFKVTDYDPPEGLQNNLLSMKKEALPNKNVINLVDGYFKDMHLVLKEMYRLLQTSGTMHIILGDARYGGINIPAGNYVTQIAEKLGFEHIETIKARDKGNSPQQMGKYGKSVSLESIISFRKAF